MALEDLVAALIAEDVSAQEFLDLFTGLGMGDHPFIAEVTQQIIQEEAFRNPVSPAWTMEDADHLIQTLASPPPPDTEFEPWSPRTTTEVCAQEDMASLAQACLQDGEFRLAIFFAPVLDYVHHQNITLPSNK